MRARSAPPARSVRGCARRRAGPCAARSAPTWRPHAPLEPPGHSCGALHLHLAVAGVRAEGPRRRELTELVADHLLRDEDRDVLAAVVDRDRMPDHLREDGRRPGPGSDHLLRAGRVHRLDALEQALFDEMPLLRGSAQTTPPSTRAKRWVNIGVTKMRSIFV